MSYIISVLFLSSVLTAGLLSNSEDKFISQKEYGQMLYKNPRGIGCHICHGTKGQGIVIVKYKHKNKIKTIRTYDMRKISYKRFKIATNKKSDNKSIMPEYFLNEDEIKSIYYFLTHK